MKEYFSSHKMLESDYTGPEALVFCLIHCCAIAISKTFFRKCLMPLTWPKVLVLLGQIK
jgi:hypothetical protein